MTQLRLVYEDYYGMRIYQYRTKFHACMSFVERYAIIDSVRIKRVATFRSFECAYHYYRLEFLQA